MVQHQAAHRHSKESEAQKPRIHKIPNQNLREILGVNISCRGHYRLSNIIASVKGETPTCIKGSFNSRRLADIVNIIRHREDDFTEWHRSDTARLFAPPVSRNEKKYSEYFF